MTTAYTSVASSSVAQAIHNCVRASKRLMTASYGRDESRPYELRSCIAGGVSSTRDSAMLSCLDAIYLILLNNYICLPDTDTDQDHEPPDDYELRPRACTETPTWIRGKPETFWHWP